MSIKILTKNSIDNTNIDGARANHFSAGMRSGIVKGAYNEGRLFTPASNKIALDSCELRISGHQVIIDSVEQIELQNAPSQPTRMSVIAEIKVNDSSVPTFRLFVQNQNVALIQDNLFKTNNGNGTYQLRIGNFTLGTTGLISDVVRTADIITGGGEGGIADIKFNATATQLSSSSQPEVNADYNEETKEWDLNFGIPAGSGSRVTIGGVEQPTWSADPVYQLSNPNLLINGDFRINQRGQTSYANTYKYTVDRWIQTVNRNTITVLEKGIRFAETTSGAYNWLLQSIEGFSNLLGKTVTLSCKISNLVLAGNNALVLGMYNANTAYQIDDVIGTTNITNDGVYSVTIDIPNSLSKTHLNVAFVLPYGDGTASVDIEWVKLEIGSIATPFSPRPYAEELALCQRYYYRMSGTSTSDKLVSFGLSNGSQAFFPFIFPTTLRVNPTLLFSYGDIDCYNGVSGGAITISNLVFSAPTAEYNQATFRADVTGTSAKDVLMLRIKKGTTSYIAVDSEIY